MTPCLGPDQFIDVLDGSAEDTAAAHLAECAVCQATLAEVRLTLAAAAEAEVPEPSPLFWSQVNARVQGALDGTTQHGATGWWAWLRFDVIVPLAGMALIVAALTSAVGRVPTDRSTGRSAARPGGEGAKAPVVTATAGEPASGDGALELMLDLAATLPGSEWDTFGLAALPDLGVVAQSLSPDEQHALVVLLQAAVDRPQS